MKTFTFFAAGVQFRKEYKLMQDQICAGDTVMLVLEPDNQYDPGAIKLLWQAPINQANPADEPPDTTPKHIGYVPKDKNGITTQRELLDAFTFGQTVTGVVFNHSPANKTWLALEIGVTVTEPNEASGDAFDAEQEERLWSSVEDDAGGNAGM